MTKFNKTVNDAEKRSVYLNLTDDGGQRYGHLFSNTKLLVMTEDGKRYNGSINTLGNQLTLRRWFEGESVFAGDKLEIQFDPTAPDIDGRTPIKIVVIERTELADTKGSTTQSSILDSDDEITIEKKEFAYENDLRNYLVRNLSIIENGLKLYEANGTTGEEFYIPGTSRRIDILAVDKQDKFVVIELKVSRGYEKVVGQTLFYQSSIKTIFKLDKVRAIIIAREITSELKTATQFLQDFELFEYQLSLTLNKIK